MYEKITWDRLSRRSGRRFDFFSLAPTPHDEECTQAGGSSSDQKAECVALINQLRRVHGDPPEGAEFVIIKNTGHDFGEYLEAGICFIPEDEEAEDPEESPSMEYALKCESGIPDKWDDKAIEELRESGHSKYQPAKIIQLRKTA